MSQNGKGDKRRPTQVGFDTYSANWDMIFNKKPRKGKSVVCPGYRCTYRHFPHINDDNPCANCGRKWSVCTGKTPLNKKPKRTQHD